MGEVDGVFFFLQGKDGKGVLESFGGFGDG